MSLFAVNHKTFRNGDKVFMEFLTEVLAAYDNVFLICLWCKVGTWSLPSKRRGACLPVGCWCPAQPWAGDATVPRGQAAPASGGTGMLGMGPGRSWGKRDVQERNALLPCWEHPARGEVKCGCELFVRELGDGCSEGARPASPPREALPAAGSGCFCLAGCA